MQTLLFVKLIIGNRAARFNYRRGAFGCR